MRRSRNVSWMKKQVRENPRLRIEQPRAPGALRPRPAPTSAHPHARHCVGCPLIDVPYPHQLTCKRARIVEALAAYPELSSVEVPAVIPAPQRLGYRCRVKLVVRRHGDGVALGLYLPQSHRVMDISSCPVHPQRVNQVIVEEERRTGVARVRRLYTRKDTARS